MGKYTIRTCRFDTTLDIGERRGKIKLTYDSIKARVIEAGCYSIFEATASPKRIALFTQLERDPELEIFRNPPEYPWIGVRRRETSKT